MKPTPYDESIGIGYTVHHNYAGDIWYELRRIRGNRIIWRSRYPGEPWTYLNTQEWVHPFKLCMVCRSLTRIQGVKGPRSFYSRFFCTCYEEDVDGHMVNVRNNPCYKIRGGKMLLLSECPGAEDEWNALLYNCGRVEQLPQKNCRHCSSFSRLSRRLKAVENNLNMYEFEVEHIVHLLKTGGWKHMDQTKKQNIRRRARAAMRQISRMRKTSSINTIQQKLKEYYDGSG